MVSLVIGMSHWNKWLNMVSIELRLNYDSWTKSGAGTDGFKRWWKVPNLMNEN